MGNSTIKLQDVYDTIAAKGIFDPRSQPAGFGARLSIDLADQSMSDILTERFNWKFNSAVAQPFYTNGFQQDYPQPAQTPGVIGWGESCTLVDANSAQTPPPIGRASWKRQLPVATIAGQWADGICWMYNKDLMLGTWPGPAKTYSSNKTTGALPRNPVMSMLDANGNILIVTGYGVTGTTAPAAPAASKEGFTVTDGTVTWTVVDPNSQGFRLSNYSAVGPTLQVIPVYQMDPPRFATLQQTLDPLPDSYSRHFYRLLEAECLIASPAQGDLQRGMVAKKSAMLAMLQAITQGDKEQNVFRLIPAGEVVEERMGGFYPITAGRPY